METIDNQSFHCLFIIYKRKEVRENPPLEPMKKKKLLFFSLVQKKKRRFSKSPSTNLRIRIHTPNLSVSLFFSPLLRREKASPQISLSQPVGRGTQADSNLSVALVVLVLVLVTRGQNGAMPSPLPPYTNPWGGDG